jgi:hypothetical protein
MNVGNNVAASIRALGCERDYSVCDVALDDYETGVIEIHSVRIVLDDTISDNFKSAFNMNDDGTIDVVASEGIKMSGMFSYYDEDTRNNLSFDYLFDSNGKWRLTLSNYFDGTMESHLVSHNLIRTNPTNYYSSNIFNTVEIFPGENKNYWDSLSFYAGKRLAKGDQVYGVMGINTSENKCIVAIYNSDKKLEIHETSVIVKDGKSPEYAAILPGDTVSLNAVYKNDAGYVYDVSRAYFLSKTKKYVFMNDFDGKRAKVMMENFGELHTMNVEFAKGDDGHAAIVDSALDKLNSRLLSFTIDDLEYVNTFYYKNPDDDSPVPYNSKRINDSISSIVGNKHIGYALVEYGGFGDEYSDLAASKVVLYYDGIAYGEMSSSLMTNVRHIIYIPDDVENTADAFVGAAQKRVDEYLGENNGIAIRYDGDFADEEKPWLSDDDLEGFDGRYYKIIYRNKQESILIIKNSAKMQKATFHASDVTNNISVSSDNVAYPTDTVVSSEIIDDSSTDIRKLLKKLGLKAAQIVNIGLYSQTIGLINQFNGTNFDVSVPIDLSKFSSKNLFAYFIGDDGKVEKHPIAMDDFLGIFKVNHFSTYIIGEEISDDAIEEVNTEISQNTNIEKNPSTYDDVVVWAIVGCISAFGLAGSSLFLRSSLKARQ